MSRPPPIVREKQVPDEPFRPLAPSTAELMARFGVVVEESKEVCERAVDRRIHARLSIHCHLLVRRPQHQHLSHMAREGASGGTGVR